MYSIQLGVKSPGQRFFDVVVKKSGNKERDLIWVKLQNSFKFLHKSFLEIQSVHYPHRVNSWWWWWWWKWHEKIDMIRWGPHHEAEDEVDVAYHDDDNLEDIEHLQRSSSSGTESIWDITDDSLGGLNLIMMVILMMMMLMMMVMMMMLIVTWGLTSLCFFFCPCSAYPLRLQR